MKEQRGLDPTFWQFKIQNSKFKMKSNNLIVEKSFSFAIRIVNLYKYLAFSMNERVMSTQILKSGTSIGANVKEAIRAQSKPDFYSKMNIALKEASETEYWLELLHESEFITDTQFNSIYADCKELLKILTSITKTQKSDEN